MEKKRNKKRDTGLEYMNVYGVSQGSGKKSELS